MTQTIARKSSRKGFYLVAFLTANLATAGWGQAVPSGVNFQGRLTDASGNPINTTVSIVFSLYNVASGGANIWTETQPNVVVSTGVYNVTLGSVVPLSAAVLANPSAYLGIKVAADAEMTPRLALQTVPYAFVASSATAMVLTHSSVTIIDSNASSVSGDSYSLAVTTASDRSVYHLVVSTNGNVGIGTTSPAQKLQVYGTAGNVLSSVQNTNPSGYSGLQLFSDVNQSYLLYGGSVYAGYAGANSLDIIGGGGPIAFFNTAAEAMRITSSGNVGIGTTNPGSLLTIATAVNTTAPVIELNKPSGGGATNWTIQGGIDGSDNGLFAIRDKTANQSRLTINVSGNVGIGTTSPGAKLDVNGNAAIRGASGLGLSPGLMVLVSSANVSNATTVTLALPSQYSSFLVMGRLQNTNVSARSLMLRIGGDTGNNYNWSTLEQYITGTQIVGCSLGAWLGATDTTGNIDRVAASAWASISMKIEVNSPSVLSVDSTVDVNFNDIGSSASHHLQGTYTGSTQTQLNFAFQTVTSCTANTISANSASGIIYVFALPF